MIANTADFADSCEECKPSTSSAEATENQVVSLLDRLKPPNGSDFSRKRKINVNRGGEGGNRQSVSRNEEPNHAPQVSAKKRLEEFSKESFKVVSNTVLFCQACKEEISVKKSVITGHIASKQHSTNKEKLAKAKEREMDIAEALNKFHKEHYSKAEALLTVTRVYRVKIEQALLKRGTSLN